MNQIPFNVSARAALLIGRENIANSKGAIIELVKNCYDADSLFCIIYIDNELSVVQETITEQQKKRMIAGGIKPSYFDRVYTQAGNKYILNASAENRYVSAFKKRIKSLSALYIIDAGDGMSSDTIINHWMTIGTDNKLIDYQTKSDRVKSGAKGIGRFALDKLGKKCTMITIPNANKLSSQAAGASVGSFWSVDWSDFEGRGKNISDVTATLGSIQNSDLIESTHNAEQCFDLNDLWCQLGNVEYRNKDDLPERDLFDNFRHGTVLKLTKLNDDWSPELVAQVFQDLEILVPPKDIENFRIFLLSSLERDKYGEILGPECEDYDYKVEAKATAHQEVEITIFREEYDIDKIPKEFLELASTKDNLPNFPQKMWAKKYRFSELLTGFQDYEDSFSKIGAFDFNFYFLKRTSKKTDIERFYYKEISDKNRKEWLKQFAGIKIYRDNFRVRPYGEIKDAAFDWLGLGLRQASSPAGVAKESRGYKGRPENIAGAIKISRLTNLEFEDKSSREGLQETHTFKVFKNLIISIIAKFEEDRSSISRELNSFHKRDIGSDGEINQAETESLAKQIIEREREKRQNTQPRPFFHPTSTGISSPSNAAKNETEDLAILARYAEGMAEEKEKLLEEQEKLLEEQKLLRGMASSGIVAASFGHDLSKTKDSLSTRFEELTDLLAPKVVPADFDGYSEFNNPFEFIKEMKRDDRNISMWLGFSLGFARKDKRKRKQIFLDQFFRSMKMNWMETLSERGISLTVECPEDLKMRIFEIDFDSMFLNLLVNSIEAFKNSRTQVERKIYIECIEIADLIQVKYSDTGPGLPSHLTDPTIIFEPMYTTKRDSVGQEVGTGLGMWIVKVISEEYQANAQLLVGSEHSGFGIVFNFPQRYKASTKP